MFSIKTENNFIMGRIAETIVSLMLENARYNVYRFGYEGILQSLAQRGLPKMQEGDPEAEKIRSMPDFVVMKDGDASFVEVKARTTNKLFDRNDRWFKNIVEYWPETRLIFVIPDEPYFLISRVKDLFKTGKLYPLEKERFLKVEKRIIDQFAGFNTRYLVNENL